MQVSWPYLDLDKQFALKVSVLSGHQRETPGERIDIFIYL